MAGTISFSGLSASGIDTSGWVDALVSVKQQTVTSLEREKEAKESLLSVVNNIKSYFSSFQSCLQKITDSQYGIASMDLFMQNLAISSNVNIATATATTEAARQSYDVAVDSLATTTKATSGYSQYEVRYATYDTRLGLLGAKNGTITVNSQSFNITVDDTISTLISKFKNVGVDAEFDEKKGAFTIGVSVDEIDEGNTNIKRALKLQDNAVDGATSGSLVYVTRDTEFSKLGLTGGKLMIEGAEHTITQNGDNYTIQKAGEAAVDMNTLGDFLDYLKSAAVNAEDASVDNKGNITIKGATLDKVEGGSNLIDILNLIESAKRTVSESDKLSYIEVHAADLNTKLSALGINADTTLTAGGVTHTITNDKTLGDIQNLLKDAGVDFNVSDKGVIVVNTNGNEISGTLLDVLNLDPSKGGTTITSTEHQAKFNADGSTLLSDLGINDSYKYTAYKSDGTAVTQEVSNLSGKTIDELVADLKAAGLDASFDKKLHQLVIKDGYIEGTLADALGMSEKTTTYTESATLNTKLEKLGATGNQTLTIDGGAQKTYSKDVTLDTVLNDIKDAGGKVEFKDGNITITGVTLGGTLPVLLGLDATTQGTSVSSGKLTVVTDTGSSGGNNDATVEHDIDLNTKIGDITGTTGDYTLAVDKGTSTTYSKNTTLQTLKNQIEGAGGKFTINDDNTISIEDVTLSGTLVGALGFDEVATGTRFSTVNAVMVQGTSNIANGGTSLGNLGIVSGATRMMARAAAAPAAGINGATLSIDGGAEITYNSTTTLDDIFADIRAAGGTASIDADGYILIDGVHLEGSLVGALGLVETSERTTITSGDLKVTTETSSTSSSTLFGSDKGDISWDSTIGSITNDTNSYNLSLNGVDTIYGTNTKLSDIKTAVENAGGVMTINSDNTISIKGVELGGTLVSKLGFTVDQIHTIVSSNDPIYYQGSDVVADTGTKFSQLGVADNLRDYAIYMNDGTIVKASSTDGTAGDKTIGDWLKIINDQLNAANGTTGSVYASINNGVISITGGYVTGSLATALGIGTKTTVTGITMEGTSVSYVDSDPLKYIGVINRGDGYASSDVTNNGSISNSINQAGTAAGNAASNGWMIGTSHYQDLWGNVTEATLNATLKELLDPSVSDPLDTDARLTASSYTLKIGSYAEKTFDSATTTLQDVINYVDNLKQYDATYDIAFDAYLYNGKLIIKSDAEVTGTLADVIGLTKTATEDEYYTYTAKNVKYTDLIEGASNGFNFSIVGDKVIYDKTETGSRDGYEYTGDKIQNPAKVEGSPDGFIKNPSIQDGSSSGINVSPDGFIKNPTIHGDTGELITGDTLLTDIFGQDVVGKTIRIDYIQNELTFNKGSGQETSQTLNNTFVNVTIDAATTFNELASVFTLSYNGYSATLFEYAESVNELYFYSEMRVEGESTSSYDKSYVYDSSISGTFIDLLNQKVTGYPSDTYTYWALPTSTTEPDKTYVSGLTDFVSGETYYIKEAADLNKLALLVNDGKNTENVTFILENDIDVAGGSLNVIGDENYQDAVFKGTFYGNGHVIKNFEITSQRDTGLFGVVYGAHIEGLGLENVTISGGLSAGALIGKSFEHDGAVTTVTNCYVKGGSVTSSADQSEGSVGGLIGRFNGTGIEIKNSYADVTVTATGAATAGGLIGSIGSSVSLISHSFAFGDVSSNGGAGGLAGTMGPSSKVEHSYASGNVTGVTYSDGLVGYFAGDSIKTSYATGQVNGANSITLYNSSGNAVTGKTLADLQTQATMEGLGFTSANGWKYTTGVSPHFGNVTVTSGTSEKVYVSSLTDFVSGNTYYIKNSDDLNKLAELTNAGKNTTGVTFILENDIDMSGVSNFAGIGGKSTNSFKGTFYGNGHVIENLTMNIDSDSWFGLFGYTSGATIKDIALKNVNITNTNGGGGTYTGGLVGYATDSTIENAYVSGGSITSKSMATGGLIGGIKGTTTIKNAYADITINVNVSNDSSSGGYAVGGLVGEMNDNSKIELSFATGDITGAAYQVGGLVGRSLSSDNKINNAYSTVNVSSTRNNAIAGGLIGSNKATVINTYATGTVSGVTAGGLIGENNGTVNYGIYNSDSNSKGVGTGSTTSVTGSTLAELTSDRWNSVLASADGWEYTTGVGMTFGNYITTTTGGGTVSTATTIGELFGGDTASRTLTVKLDGGTAKDLTFASTDSIQTVIDKLAAEGITASLTAEGKFKVASEKQYILSGDLAKKLFGGDGNKLYTYSGTKVTYTTGSSSVEFDEFIKPPGTHTGGSSGSSVTNDGFIKPPGTHTGGSGGSSVTNDGFINNPTIQGGGSSSSIVDYDGFIKDPTIQGGGVTTGTTVTYTRGAVTLPTTSTSISSSTKLVDLFGSGVIGTTIVTTSNSCLGGYEAVEPDLGIGSGSSSGPNAGNNQSQTVHVHISHSGTSTKTIDADTTLADLGSLYNSSTGEIRFTEDSFSDCTCFSSVTGTFFDKIGITPTITFENNAAQKLTRMVTTYKIPNAITTGGGGNASTSTTMKELFNNTSSHTFSVVWDDGSTGSTFTLSSTDTIQTLFDKLATIGITASIDSSGKFTYVSSKDWRATGDLGEKIGSDPFYTISGNALTTKSSTTTTIHPVTTKISSFNSSAVGTRIWVKSDQYTGSTTGYIAQNANFRYLDINANTTIQDIVNLYNSIGGTAHYDTLTGEVVVELQRGYSLSVGNGFPYSRPNLQVGTESEGGTYKIMMGGNSIINNGTPAEETTKMNEIFGAFIGSKEFTLTNNGETHTISFTGDDTIADLVDKLNATGVSATFSKALLASRINVESRHSDFEIGVNETSKKLFGYASLDGTDYIVSKVPAIGHTATYSGGSTSKVYVSSLTDFKSGDTYYIKTAADLNKLAELTNAGKDTTNVSFVLENDIDLSGVTGFTPIGTDSAEFKGMFYGNGHVIKNLTVNTAGKYAGLFGSTKGGKVQDLGLVNVKITGSATTNYVGALIGKTNHTTVDNCFVDGDVTSLIDGGVASVITGSVAGGLIGYLVSGSITNSYTNAKVEGTKEAGGLVGITARDGTTDADSVRISYSFAIGGVSGGTKVGGLIGSTAGNDIISNVYSLGEVSSNKSDAYVGGLVGSNSAHSIDRAYTTSIVTCSSSYTGGLFGYSGGTVTNSVYNSANSKGVGAGTSTGTGKTLAEIKTQSVMEGLGFTAANGWKYTTGATPNFGNATVTSGPLQKVYVSSLTDFVSGNTYYIKNAADLNKLAELTNAGKNTSGVSFILENDIDMSGVTNFTPIGTDSNTFKGSFYGNGHVIKNLTIANGTAGLFGVVEYSTIQDLGLENVQVTNNSSNSHTAILGTLAAKTISANIVNVYATGTITDTNIAYIAGGLVGEADGGTSIEYSYADVDLNTNAENVGGLVGVAGGRIMKSFATGNVAGERVGGLVGSLDGDIMDAYATGDVSTTLTSTYEIGGLVGRVNGGVVSQTYATGKVTGGSGSGKIGGLIGYLGADVTNISDNVFNTDSIMAGIGSGSSTGVTGKTLAEIQTQSVMEGLGFTAANGWKYTTGATPNFGNVTITSGGDTNKVYVSSLTDFVAGETYYIKTAADLNKLAELVNNRKDTTDVTFILENDIDMSGVTGFTPIGNGGIYSNAFKGTFYGNGHVIKNLIVDGSYVYAGLFGVTVGADIQDLGLENVLINSSRGDAQIGTLIGMAEDTIINNVYSIGHVRIDETTGTGYAGGLIGKAVKTTSGTASITNSYALVDVRNGSDTGYAGGLVGYATADMDTVYANGNVKGYIVGGLVGYSANNRVSNAYATGDVEGLNEISYVGGFIGSGIESTIYSAYATGNVNGTGTYTGAFIGAAYQGNAGADRYVSLSGCYFDSAVGLDFAGYTHRISGTATGVTLAQLSTPGIFSTGPWQYTTGTTPHFGNVTVTSGPSQTVYVSSLTDFVSGDTYYIKTAADLNKLAELTNAGKDTSGVSFILENDIDMASVANFTPIGTTSNTFKGTFYGNGHVIKNLKINSTSGPAGLFGAVEGATIEDLGLENVNISGASNVGALIGHGNASVSNVYVKGGSITASGDYAGGLIGRGYVNVSNSYADVSVTASGDYAGGLVGEIGSSGGSISNSFASGDVSANDYAGGLIGALGPSDTIENSFAIGNVTATSGTNSGGLGGFFADSSSVKTSYSTGQVNGADSITLYNSSGTAVTGKTLADLKTQTTMQGLGFTDANGWKYTSGVTPHFGNVTVTDTTQTHTASNSTTMGQLFGDTASHTLTVDGTNITIATSDTVSNVFEKLAEKGIMASMENGVISIESSGAHTLTGDVTQKLFGASTVTLTTNSPAGTYTLYKVAGTGDVTTTYTMDVNTKIGDLFGDTNNHTFTINGEDITLGADKTIQDLINALAAKGYTVSVTDGKMTIGSNGNSSFTVSGDLADKVLKKTGTVESDYKTQEVTLSTGSKMKDIFWDNDTHDFVINKADGTKVTISLSANDNIQTLIDKLKQNGVAATIDSNGKMTFKSNYQWSASGDLGDLITGGVEMSKVTTPLYTFTSDDVNMYTGVQYVSDMTELVAGNKYHIKTAADLVALANFIKNGADTTGTRFYLDNDIDMSSVANFTAIGTSANKFKGTVYGNGYTVKNLKVDTTELCAGLFGFIENATIQDLGITDADIKGTAYAGILVGKADNSTIKNVYSTGKVTATADQIGGLIGDLNGESSIAQNIYSTAEVLGKVNVGGLIGYLGNNAVLENAYATGDVNSSEHNVGGLVGAMRYGGTVKNAYATGNIEAGSGMHIGGLIGLIESNGGGSYVIDTVYSTGRVHGGTNVGGLIGYRLSTNVTVTNGVFNSNLEISGVGNGSTAGIVGKTYVEMQNASVMQGLGFTTAKGWKYVDKYTPILNSVSVSGGGKVYVNGLTEFRAGDTYYIASKEDLNRLAELVNMGEDTTGTTFILDADINMSGVDFAGIGKLVNTGGTNTYSSEYVFKGDFYGNGHVISNLTTDQGLFTATHSATIRDVGLENVKIESTNEQYAGALIGMALATTVTNSYVKGGTVTVTRNDGQVAIVGGLVGALCTGSISESYSDVVVTADGGSTSKMYAGGFIGGFSNISFSAGTIVENNITKSYATGDVIANGKIVGAGGFLGFANAGDMNITTSFSTGNIYSSGEAEQKYLGGFVAFVGGSLGNTKTLNIVNSYSSSSVDHSGSAGGFIGEITDKGVVNVSGGAVYNKSTELSAIGSGTLTSGSVVGMLMTDMIKQDKMEAQGFTADKGWKYFADTTPVLNANVTVSETGGKRYVSGVEEFRSGDTYYISTAADLQKLSTLVNSGQITDGVKFVLENDIDMSSIANFTSIGTDTNSFNGEFVGNGFIISNLKVDAGSGKYTGLFGYIENASIRDVAVENANVKGGDFVGILVGGAKDSVINNVYATGTVNANSFVGGLIGSIDAGSTVSDSYANANVTAVSLAGGLLGTSEGNVNNSFASGTVRVTGTEGRAGGLVGQLNGGSIKTSYSDASVSGTREIGGFVGCDNHNATISNSYAIGSVSGTTQVGAFIGNSQGKSTLTGNISNSTSSATAIGTGSRTGVTSLTIDKIQDKATMESYGFTSDLGWVYYEGKAPMLQQKDTSTQHQEKITLDTILSNIGNNSISKDITVTVNGNTTSKIFDDNTTVGEVIDWLNGIADINASFDSTNSKLTISADYGDLKVEGGLANMLFGDRTTITKDEITENTDSSNLFAQGNKEKITGNTTVGQLMGMTTGSASIGYKDDTGKVIMKAFGVDQTLNDVIAYLNSQGFTAKIENGVFTAEKDGATATDILGALGNKLKGDSATVVTNPSGYTSGELASTNSSKATANTKLSQLGIDSGRIYVQDASGNVLETIQINNEMTINDAAQLLANYGFTLSINDGKVTVKGEGTNKLVDGTSNMVSKMKLDNWIETKDTLKNNSTVAQMGFSDGAVLGLIVNGKSYNLAFDADDTLNDIISTLGTYGITASVDANGKFTASGDGTFVLTNELGAYLTQNSVEGYVTEGDGYKSDKPLEFDKDEVLLTEDTTIGELLGTGQGGILRLTLDENTVIDLEYEANETMRDVMTDLAGYGITAKIKDGVLTAVSTDKTFTFAGDVGKAMSGKTPQYEELGTGYLSKDLSYKTTGAATMNSTLKEMGISSGQIHILSNDGKIVSTLDVDGSFTAAQIKSMLQPYGMTMTMDANGKVSITSAEGYKLSDGTSNMVSKWGLNNWNDVTETLSATTTIGQMGFKDGADLNLFIDGAVMNILSFDADETLQDVIFALSAYGIDASVDANGMFTAVSKSHTFVMSSSLGSFLTKGTAGYVNSDTGYQTYKPLEEEHPYVVNSSGSLGYEKLMTETSTLASLGFEQGGTVRVMLDGTTPYTLEFLATDMVQDVIYALSAYGINAEVKDGKFVAESIDNQFTITGNFGSFLMSGGAYDNEITGYESAPITFETVEKLTEDTKLSDLGILRGDVNIIKDGELTGSTINITDDTTLGQLFNAIKVYGMTGSIVTDAAGNTSVRISADSNVKLADGTSNVVSGLGLTEIRQGDFEGNKVYWDDDATEGLITKDMLLSSFDRDGFIAEGSLIFETGAGDEAVEHIINISAGETVESLLNKFNDSGIKAELDNGVIKLSAGLDELTFTGGTSGLVKTIGLDIENVDTYASSAAPLTYEGEVHYSAANFADADTKLGIVNATNGTMSMFIDGIKVSIEINNEESFADLFQQIKDKVNAKTGMTIEAGFLGKDGTISSNPDPANNTGIVAFSIGEGHELVIGASNDTTNFATIANLNKTGYNSVTGSRALYKVNVNSRITESGLYRDGDITEGTFTIGDAEFTIDSNTTLSSLIDQINKSQTAYASAYWDTLSGTFVIESTITGASLINIEAGTSNFTDIMGFTTVKDGEGALVTDSQKLGQNAVVRINGTTVTSSSNVITSDISKIKGLTINLKNVSAGETVTINVEQDKEGIYEAVSDTVDAYNAMMEALGKELADRSSLGGESILKLMRNNLKRLMTSSLTGAHVFKNLASVGISTGEAQDSISTNVTSLLIDKDKFMDALASDSDAVQELLVGTQTNPGIFLQANTIVESSIKADGYFSNMADSLTRSINNIDKKISRTNDAIENYRAKLERQFHNMELTISGMQNSYANFLK